MILKKELLGLKLFSLLEYRVLFNGIGLSFHQRVDGISYSILSYTILLIKVYNKI